MSELHGFLRSRTLQLLALAGLLAGIGANSMMGKYSVLDPDLWWHLRVGDWIVGNKAVPHHGLFSSTAANRPWVAYSWGYEVLVSRMYAWFGLLGVALFGVLLTIAVAAVLFWSMHRLSGRFWTAWILTFTGCLAFLFTLMPRPVFVSMVLFSVVLTLILEAQRTGRVVPLYWLPVVFVVWANIHIQFIYGLLLVFLLLGINLLQRLAWIAGRTPGFLRPLKLPVPPLIGITAACILAACVGPYSFHLYQVVLEYSKAQGAYSLIMELQALDFGSFDQYLELLLVAAAFFALGWQKRLDAYKTALLVIASISAFRTVRDSWFVCIPALACIADTRDDEAAPGWPARLRMRDWTAAGAVVVLILLLLARNVDFNTRGLDRVVSRTFPVDAVNFVRRNPLPGPLYNSFDWGGFLIWYLPQYPVAIDGRNDLYGDELDRLFFSSEDANASYEQDPFLNAAGVVLLKNDVPLAKALLVDQKFRLVYRDPISVVFVRE